MDMIAIVVAAPAERVFPWVVLYVGPEVFMPFLSAVAGALGVLLMFWQRVSGFVARVWRSMFHRQG